MAEDLKKLNENQLRSKLKDSQEALQNFRFQKVLECTEFSLYHLNKFHHSHIIYHPY